MAGDGARVLAVVVAHDGAAWLPETLVGVASQTYDPVEVLGVDNGSTDGSRQILIDELGEDRVLVAERDLGFAAAVSMALDSALARDADYVLLLHDDCELAPDALEQLVRALDEDPHLAVVGPKLLDWDDPQRLQSVGMTVDLTGRADSGIESDELDQGQRDVGRSVLYVPTTAMLLRRHVFEELGRFDRRYHLFRDDLDLCWRAWLRGWDVEIVPDAVAVHAAAAANYDRLGQTAFLGPRYFAERNTLATLLKVYSARRLALVLPLFVLVGLAKVAGFVATRRLSDAWQTLRAWAWNVLHLRETWRLRSQVQSTRQRQDQELQPLLARVAPRARAYGEALADWLAGGETEIEAPEPQGEPETATRRILGYVAARPVTVAAVILFVVGVIIAFPLLQAGDLRGGDIGAWPDSPMAFFEDYTASWHDAGASGTSTPPSPAQPILGLVTLLAAGSGWLASRLVLLGVLPLAWVLGLRAGRVLGERRVPRLAAATVFVLSPPVIAALLTGRLAGIALVGLLPPIVAAGAVAVDPRAPAPAAWRASAALALLLAVLIAFSPPTAIVVVVLAALAVAVVPVVSRGERVRSTLLRILAVVLGVLLLLLPWSLELFRATGPIFDRAAVGASYSPFWRWLIAVPTMQGFGGLLPGLLLALGSVIGTVFGLRRRGRLVAGLWLVIFVSAILGWLFGRAGAGATVWAGLPLIVTAMGHAGLLGLAVETAGDTLGEHDFGWRQLAAAAAAAAVLFGVIVGGSQLWTDRWSAYAVGEASLPAFLAVDVETAGEFRVLVLADRQGAVEWDLTTPRGPTVLGYGVSLPETLIDTIDEGVADMLGGADTGAAGRLALAGIRYIVVPPGGTSEILSQGLSEQLGLEPQPVADGQVFRLSGWLPTATFVPLAAVDATVRLGELPAGVDAQPLERVAPVHWVGEDLRQGSVLVSEVSTPGWQAVADGTALEIRDRDGFVRVDVPADTEQLTVEHGRQGRRTAVVLLQLFFVLIALSLVLRPPGFTEEDAP